MYSSGPEVAPDSLSFLGKTSKFLVRPGASPNEA